MLHEQKIGIVICKISKRDNACKQRDRPDQEDLGCTKDVHECLRLSGPPLGDYHRGCRWSRGTARSPDVGRARATMATRASILKFESYATSFRVEARRAESPESSNHWRR